MTNAHKMQEIKEVVVQSILDVCPNFGITANSKLKDIGASLKSAGLTKMAPSSNTAARVAIHSQYDRITGESSLKEWLESKKHREEARKQKRKKKENRRKKKKKQRKIYSPVKTTIFAKTKEFLDSWEWTTLRYEVLKEFGRRCMCCGATPETGAVICVDHIKPRHTHPELALERKNLQVLCFECNKGKGAWDETDFR